jgi:glyoxylase-like metal-dependent hydrolase (beta-lactamase superfamily II)
MAYKTWAMSDRVSLIQETGVAACLRCNIWHVRGRDHDLVIDTGMGLASLKGWLLRETDRPIKAIVTHSHFDHSGGLHEFDCRLGHRAEAHILAAPDNAAVVYSGAWTRIEVVDRRLHPDFDPATYHITPAPLTGYLDEGDVVDLGDCAFQVLHTPGHSPGSISLWDAKSRTVFSGDALYNGQLMDNLYHSDPAALRQTLGRLQAIGADLYHGGHFRSFGKTRMTELVAEYLRGNSTLVDVDAWYAEMRRQTPDIYADQDWTGIPVA